jgi:nucleoside-diphosphate-sugar epimerase
MKIFITGGAGYCGARMVPQLLELGYEVTVFDKCFFGSDFLPIENPKFHLIYWRSLTFNLLFLVFVL